ncbi:hypothetical protein, partial [Duodenibacillus massiliensis]|uniref:hypothetical protein n=1 Tax=Duodenibacillus massiliensis TaxID=1852381 RepID=UPI002FD9959D
GLALGSLGTSPRPTQPQEPLPCAAVRRLDGTKISAGISYKKLSLLEKRKTFLTELRKEDRDSSRV